MIKSMKCLNILKEQIFIRNYWCKQKTYINNACLLFYGNIFSGKSTFVCSVINATMQHKGSVKLDITLLYK